MSQSRQVADAVSRVTGRPVELVEITTYGDTSREHLAQIGGTGVFVTALRDALLRGEVDFAVHSLKDLPTASVPGIVLAAVPVRGDPRDALVARDGAKLADLPAGALIGTGSPRRAAQLRLMRPDVRPVPVRGNAGTRLAKVTSGQLDCFENSTWTPVDRISTRDNDVVIGQLARVRGELRIVAWLMSS